MATQAQIEQVAQALHRVLPAPFFRKVSESQAGTGAVLRFLFETEGDVTAGMIADLMGVSTARVAVLLKKMTVRGLIVKVRAPGDARITIVRLTDQGRGTAQLMRDDMYARVGQVIDKVGMDRAMEFLSIAGEIAEIMPKPGEEPCRDFPQLCEKE